ncbi:MAG: hypothetical protein Q9218_000705 [Villophora microphyllina]
MPKIRGITVHVTDGSGNALQEWGEQSLRGSKISAYIKSTTDMPFKVSIQPDLPYIHDAQPLQKKGSQSEEWEDIEDTQVKMEDMREVSAVQKMDLGEKEAYRSSRTRMRQLQTRQDNRKHHLPSSSSIIKHEDFNKPSPSSFSLLATLYLDGRKKPERRSVVYLDPDHEDFNQPDGRIQFKSRLVQRHDGLLEERAWVFKELGIETVFNKIGLLDDTKGLVEPDDQLVNAMGNSTIGNKDLEIIEEPGKVGQIVVELHRITLGRPYYEPQYRASHLDGENEDVDMEGLTNDTAHATG